MEFIYVGVFILLLGFFGLLIEKLDRAGKSTNSN